MSTAALPALPATLQAAHQLLREVLCGLGHKEKVIAIRCARAVDTQHELEDHGITWKSDPELMTIAVFMDVDTSGRMPVREGTEKVEMALRAALPPSAVQVLLEFRLQARDLDWGSTKAWGEYQDRVRSSVAVGDPIALAVMLLLVVRRVARVQRYWTRRDARLFQCYAGRQDFDSCMSTLYFVSSAEWPYRKVMSALLDEHLTLFSTWE